MDLDEYNELYEPDTIESLRKKNEAFCIIAKGQQKLLKERADRADKIIEELQEALSQIIHFTWHCIPYYAYGDNEAATDMANRLKCIDEIANAAYVRSN